MLKLIIISINLLLMINCCLGFSYSDNDYRKYGLIDRRIQAERRDGLTNHVTIVCQDGRSTAHQPWGPAGYAIKARPGPGGGPSASVLFSLLASGTYLEGFALTTVSTA